MTENKNYEDYILDPKKDVLVPIKIYQDQTRLIKALVDGAKEEYGLKFAHFDKKTHKKLSANKKSKMKPEKLMEDYYENIDLEATGKNRNLSFTKEQMFALQLQAKLPGVFRYNVDQGNGLLKSELEVNVPAPNLVADEG